MLSSASYRGRLNIFGPANDLGYGVHARSFALALQEAGWETSFSPIGGGRQFPPELHPLVGRSGSMLHDSTSICIWHEWEMQFFCGNPRIAFPVFETTLLTQQGVHHLSQIIEGGGNVFTPSTWSQAVLLEHGIGSVVVPEGVDPIYFNPDIIPNIVAKEDTFTFVNVGKFEKRKGVDLLLNAYAKNFYNKDVRLLGLWSNPFNKDWAKEIHETLTSLGFSKVDTLANRNVYRLNDCKVELVGRLSDRRFVATMIKAADCAIYPHRAEGWGLPIIESMALGVPTIATFYSGPTEYLTPENAELIHVSQLETAIDGQFFKGDRGNWAVVEEDLVAEAMLKAYYNIEDIPSDPYGVIGSWSWKNAAEVASKFIEEVDDGNDEEQGGGGTI